MEKLWTMKTMMKFEDNIVISDSRNGNDNILPLRRDSSDNQVIYDCQRFFGKEWKSNKHKIESKSLWGVNISEIRNNYTVTYDIYKFNHN